MTIFLGPTKVSVSTDLHHPWYLPLIATNSCLRQGLKTVDVQVRWTWIWILTATYGRSMRKSVKMPEAQIPHLWKRAGQWHHFRTVRRVKWDNNAKYLAQGLKVTTWQTSVPPFFLLKWQVDVSRTRLSTAKDSTDNKDLLWAVFMQLKRAEKDRDLTDTYVCF